jgi:ribosomal protein L32
MGTKVKEKTGSAKEEQNNVREKYYNKAMRYMDNAKETLQKAGIDGDFYEDEKYVKSACGIAYIGLLVALEGYSIVIGYQSKAKKKERRSIDYYREMFAGNNQSLLKELNSAYNILHLCGYYDGEKSIAVIKDGFKRAYRIVEKIKPIA